MKRQFWHLSFVYLHVKLEILCKKWKHSLVLIWNLPADLGSWALEGYRVKRVNFHGRAFDLKWTYHWSWNIWMAFWVGKACILNTYLIWKKFRCLWVAWEGMLKLRFDWYFVLSINIFHFQEPFVWFLWISCLLQL